LAIPAWDTPPRTLQDWLHQFEAHQIAYKLKQDEGETWIVFPDLFARALVVQEGGGLEALNFELPASADPSPRPAIEQVAAALGWELHDEDGDEKDEDED
jgi:hypothetical protein